MFRTNLLSTIRSLNSVFTSVGNCHTSYVDCLLARSGWITMHGPLNVKLHLFRSFTRMPHATCHMPYVTCHTYIVLLDLFTYQWFFITNVNVCRCVYVCAYAYACVRACMSVCVCVYVSRHLPFLLLQR